MTGDGSGCIRQRKDEHLRITLGLPPKEVEYTEVTTGFEDYRFKHLALPGIDLENICLSTSFLGHALSMPLMISCMTGGTPRAGELNRRLACVAQRLGIAMGVGSQRIALEDPSIISTFQVRDVAPDIPLVANLGAAHLANGDAADMAKRAVEMIGADFLAIHLNPIQEALQEEGSPSFARVLDAIQAVCSHLPVPVIVKEVGFGISSDVARLLRGSGVAAIDIAGAGGTSWAKIEGHRSRPDRKAVSEAFAKWGIPTAEALAECHASVPELPIIASGGIRTGLDIAKSLALGAEIAAVGLPLLHAANDSEEAAERLCVRLADELRVTMFGIGAKDVTELRLTTRLERLTQV